MLAYACVCHALTMEGDMSTAIAHPDVAGRIKRNEVVLAFRGLIEEVRLGMRDVRRIIRRMIAAYEWSPSSSGVQTTSSPTPLVSVPLVVLAPTTDREQIELNDLVHSLGAAGYEVAPRGATWVVYTEIPDRRKSAIGGSAQDRRRFAARVREAIAMESETRQDERGSLQLSHDTGT
jgi:hypothetical protein